MKAAKALKRLYYKVTLNQDGDYDQSEHQEAYQRSVKESDANLVSSRLSAEEWWYTNDEEAHAPALDIDNIEVTVKPSSTQGCYHLFIDKEMPWSDYALLLCVLGKVGILEPGYVEASLTRRASFLRHNTTKAIEKAARAIKAQEAKDKWVGHAADSMRSLDDPLGNMTYNPATHRVVLIEDPFDISGEKEPNSWDWPAGHAERGSAGH